MYVGLKLSSRSSCPEIIWYVYQRALSTAHFVCRDRQKQSSVASRSRTLRDVYESRVNCSRSKSTESTVL